MLLLRRKAIVEKIEKENTVYVSELMKEYGVSIETIRRDLEYLESQGYLKRVYGGAVLEGLFGKEPEYAQREIKNYAHKKAIGKKAAKLIKDGDTIFVDVGTTTLEVVKNLSHKKDLTIITNSTVVAQETVEYEKCRVILLGGQMRKGELSVSGLFCVENLKHFYADKAILGVGGITAKSGITDYHVEESIVRKCMVENASCTIAVADYSKFGVIAMNHTCSINKLNYLVTDWDTPKKLLADYRNLGILIEKASNDT